MSKSEALQSNIPSKPERNRHRVPPNPCLKALPPYISLQFRGWSESKLTQSFMIDSRDFKSKRMS